MTHWTDTLVAMDACGDAVEWARTQPDSQTAWDTCQRGDWMLWYAGKIGADRTALVLAACDCAETAADYADSDTQMTIVWTLETARMWARGDGGIGIDDVRDAAAAAYAAYAYADAAAAAAYAYAAYAAYAAAAAAYAAYAYAADAAAVAHAAAANAARRAALSQCADICREYWPEIPGRAKGEQS